MSCYVDGDCPGDLRSVSQMCIEPAAAAMGDDDEDDDDDGSAGADDDDDDDDAGFRPVSATRKVTTASRPRSAAASRTTASTDIDVFAAEAKLPQLRVDMLALQ